VLPSGLPFLFPSLHLSRSVALPSSTYSSTDNSASSTKSRRFLHAPNFPLLLLPHALSLHSHQSIRHARSLDLFTAFQRTFCTHQRYDGLRCEETGGGTTTSSEGSPQFLQLLAFLSQIRPTPSLLSQKMSTLERLRPRMNDTLSTSPFPRSGFFVSTLRSASGLRSAQGKSFTVVGGFTGFGLSAVVAKLASKPKIPLQRYFSLGRAKSASRLNTIYMRKAQSPVKDRQEGEGGGQMLCGRTN